MTWTPKRAKNCANSTATGAAAQHDQGFREAGQAEGRVAGEVADVVELRKGRGGDDRPVAMTKCLRR